MREKSTRLIEDINPDEENEKLFWSVDDHDI